MNETSDPQVPRTPNPVLRAVRFLFHWLIKVIVLAALGIRAALRPRMVRYGLVVVLVAGVVGWRLFGDAIPGLNAQPMQVSGASAFTSGASPNSQLPPSPVIERYLQAEAAYNANAMYGMFSDTMKSSLPGSSDPENLAQLQSVMDSAKSEGRRYTGAVYVGGMPLENGENVYFYVLKIETASGKVSVPYIYVLGPDDKIDSIQ